MDEFLQVTQMNTALDVATALASLLADIGLDGCVACPWTALDDDDRTVMEYLKEYE